MSLLEKIFNQAVKDDKRESKDKIKKYYKNLAFFWISILLVLLVFVIILGDFVENDSKFNLVSVILGTIVIIFAINS